MIPQEPLHAAVERAITALSRLQQPSGELPTLTARRVDMADARPYPCSVYTTTFAIHALRGFAGHPIADAVAQAAGAHLRAERNLDGSWSYEGRATTRVPPDFDDTACAAAALLALGDPPDLRLYQLLWENEAAPGGPYCTWLGVNRGEHLLARQLDGLVNANLLLWAGMAGIELPGAVAYLNEIITNGHLDEASVYCFTPHLLLYAIARAATDGKQTALAAALPALRAAALALPAPPAEVEPFRLACLAATLLALDDREAAAPHLGALLATQAPEGSWPAAAAYSGYPPYYDGGPALTTAIALNAIRWALR